MEVKRLLSNDPRLKQRITKQFEKKIYKNREGIANNTENI